MYRTKCTMYDEVSVGNPGKVPYCAKQDKLEPDCQHCKQPYVTNAQKFKEVFGDKAIYAISSPNVQALKDWLDEPYKEP